MKQINMIKFQLFAPKLLIASNSPVDITMIFIKDDESVEKSVAFGFLKFSSNSNELRNKTCKDIANAGNGITHNNRLLIELHATVLNMT